MQCRTHPDQNGLNTCNQCGDWLCESCTVEINGRIFCRKCLAQLAAEPESPAKPYAERAYAAPETSASAGGRHISWGLLFLFSMMPSGINYMYEGLIKRGLAALSGFFLLIFMGNVFNVWPINMIFWFALPVFMIVCIFDGFNIRRKMNAGLPVSDDVDDIVMFLKRNKSLIVGFLVLLVALSVFHAVLSPLTYSLRRWLPVIVVSLGLYMLMKRPKNKDGKAGKTGGGKTDIGQ
jgi:hypothetical protein